jgi:hypothetical protein
VAFPSFGIVPDYAKFKAGVAFFGSYESRTMLAIPVAFAGSRFHFNTFA